MSDEELAALALAADPDPPVDPDARCLSDLLGAEGGELLPSWYMPGPGAVAGRLKGWRRASALAVVAAFLAITAAGLCNTYGDLMLLRIG